MQCTAIKSFTCILAEAGPSAKKQYQSQTLSSCISRACQQWSRESPQYQVRLSSIESMVIASGYPVAVMDPPEFRSMLTTFDPKFKVPGEYFLQFIHYICQ